MLNSVVLTYLYILYHFQLRDATKKNPVVFIPSHRSYMDFLLVSFICFSTDIPLPFIAAAADFMNMRVVRTLFRNSGAFFMRRSFMSDPLYWVVFTEYIQNQLQFGDQPLEFFLEGTRSRTGKFLQPRLGRCLLMSANFATHFCKGMVKIKIKEKENVDIFLKCYQSCKHYAKEILFQSWPHPLQSVDCSIMQTSAADANFNWKLGCGPPKSL